MNFKLMPYKDFFIRQHTKSEPEQSWYALTVKNEDQGAELYIYDFIGLFGVEPRHVIAALKDVKGKPLTVRLNTPGGSAFDGFAIYNAIREHEGGVTVIVDGLAASAGSLIAMAGEKIIMNQGSRMMIHDAWGLTVGNAEDHIFSAERLNEVSVDLADIYSSRTGVGKRMVRQMMRDETWMNAKQAKEQGFADEVAGESTQNDKAEFIVPEGLYKTVMQFKTLPENKNKSGHIEKSVEIDVQDREPEYCLDTELRRLRLVQAV